jgi:hypothetical protein
VCVLAHFLEREGIATVVISLIRKHSDTIRPPRTLFVPFELGRPLGDPGDVGRQEDVLRNALDLLVKPGPESISIDYPDPAPTPLDVNWRPPLDLPNPGGSVSASALLRELEVVLPSYRQHAANQSRTTFGNSGLSLEQVVTVVCDLLEPGASKGSRRPSKLVRFAIDDLKTIYLEAVCLGSTSLTSAQLGQWFWRATVAGQVIARLRAEFLAGTDKGRRMIAPFMVPGEWVDNLAL